MLADVLAWLQDAVSVAKLSNELYTLQLDLNISKHACRDMNVQLLEAQNAMHKKDEEMQVGLEPETSAVTATIH